jgi:uncharacterized integral membrane protein
MQATGMQEPGGEPGPIVEGPAGQETRAPRSTRASRVWIGLAAFAVVLALLIVFIAENSQRVKVSFLGASGHLALGLALLIAAVAGAVVALLAGTTRIVQLRREVRRHRRRATAT